MMPRRPIAWALVCLVMGCGEVPTLPLGIAYVSPVLSPAPAVVAGDTLRDSTGRAAPLQVLAYDRDNQLVSVTPATFVITSFPVRATITPAGYLIAADTITSLQLVGRIGDRLQTTPFSLPVVAQPDSLLLTSSNDTLTAAPAFSTPITVTVRGSYRGARITVPGVIVRYRIASVDGRANTDTLTRIVDDASGNAYARDTTNSSGTAARRVLLSTAGARAVVVEISASNFRGVPLGNSPLAVTIPVR